MNAPTTTPRPLWKRAILLAGTALALSLIATPTVVQAQSQQRAQRVIRLDAITVEGRIQKPQAIYILQRSILNFAELERTESFLPKIVQSVEKDCF
jgi:hypothetical protein